MIRRDRILTAGLFIGAIVAAVAVVALASQLCPGPTPDDPCPDAGRNQAIVVAVTGLAVTLLMTPLAFLAEYLARQGIVYQGAWWRALRRGALIGVAVVAVAGLRILDALNVFSATVVVGVAVVAEWLAIRRFDTD